MAPRPQALGRLQQVRWVKGGALSDLVALYFGSIVLLQTVFVGLTGQKSTLAVVASTLVIAALFQPLRRRLQSFIDRRFYRRKYDARKTLEAFSTKLRDETNLQALNSDLIGVVKETLQPAHVSMWLRPETAQKGEGASSPLFTKRLEGEFSELPLLMFSEVRH